MKSSLSEKEESLSTKSKVKNTSPPAKANHYLFNHVSKLAADHDVTVSNTMIKVTYKKVIRDNYESLCGNGLNFTEDPILNENKMSSSVKKSDIHNKNEKFIKSPNLILPHTSIKFANKGGNEGLMCHSNLKQDNEGKWIKEHCNGIDLVRHSVSDIKVSCDYKNKVEIKLKDGSDLSKLKMDPSQNGTNSAGKRDLNFQLSNTKFLKDINIVKIKNSLSKNFVVEKKFEVNELQKETKKKDTAKEKTNIKKKIIIPQSNFNKKVMKNNERNTKSVKIRPSNVKVEAKNRNIVRRSEKGEERQNKKPILMVDPELPSGWTRFIRTRNKGSSDEKHVVYVVSPQGKKFRFKWKLRRYLEKTNSSLDADQFFFGLYKRTRAVSIPGAENEENKLRSKSSLPEINSYDVSSREKNMLRNLSLANSEGQSSNNDLGAIENDDGSEERELLLNDPDLPFGWKRNIHSNSSSGKLEVHIISPEGKIFRRKYRLSEYLAKHQYKHNLDRFYFGLYPKKDSVDSSTEDPDRAQQSDHFGDAKGLYKYQNDEPMYDDPNLPKGWKRFIKIRSCGESAGRMEVIIVSPDGRRLRTRRHLEHYLQQKNLNFKAEDFDFSVFGKSKKRHLEPEPEPESQDYDPNLNKRIKSAFLSDGSAPTFDVDSLKEVEYTPERTMINALNGLMISCGLSSARGERRTRLSRDEHEKLIKSHLESEVVGSDDGCEVPTYWIQRLVKCRSDFRVLESDAASAIAERTKTFLKEMSQLAFQSSRQPGKVLCYEDVADVVEKWECLSSLKTLIPQKITYREFVKLNRPKQFLSFT